MKFETSDKVATFEKKPRIKRGYYGLELLSIKPRQKLDGTPIEGKFGEQIVLMFAIYSEDFKTMIKNPGKPGEQLFLPMVLNSQYKGDDGKIRTAFTPNSRITKVFKALSWEGPKEGRIIDVSDYIGKKCVGNIDDYDAKLVKADKTEEVYKASAIQGISAPDEDLPDFPAEKEKAVEKGKAIESQTVKKVVKHSDIEEKKAALKEQMEAGNLTKGGYEKAIESLEAEDER